MGYYNTTRLTGEALKRACSKARSQEQAIHMLFVSSKRGCATPSQIQQIYEKWTGKKILITSVRRALNVLTNKQKVLVKTDTKVPSPYGDVEHIWVLKSRLQ